MLINRANALCSTKKNRQDEIKHVKDNLKLNSYPNMTLNKKPSNRTEQQFKGFAILYYHTTPDSQKKYGVVRQILSKM